MTSQSKSAPSQLRVEHLGAKPVCSIPPTGRPRVEPIEEERSAHGIQLEASPA
ncbi:MAG: hypothetical protein ACLQRH_28235 [Acidimicrobiales bacterium]